MIDFAETASKMEAAPWRSVCWASSPEGFVCTLVPGHEGDHIALATGPAEDEPDEAVRRWQPSDTVEDDDEPQAVVPGTRWIVCSACGTSWVQPNWRCEDHKP